MDLVTGATGFIGAHVARALLGSGARVRCLVRPGCRRENLIGLDAEIVEGDLSDPDSLARAVAGCRRVFHCAADYRLWARDPAALYRTNVEGTRSLLQRSAAAGVERFVHTSSVGALGLNPDGTPANENTPTSLAAMVGHYKRSKFLAERLAESWAKGGRLAVVIVNPSAPVGELDIKPTPTGQMIVDFLNGRVPAYVQTGLNLVDVRDVAAGHLLAAERGTPGEKYILGNRNLRLKEIYEALAKLSGRRPPRLRLPHFVPLAYAAVATAWADRTGRPPAVPLDSVRMARTAMFFDASRAVRVLGLPQTPVEEALGRAFAWFRTHGYVR